jgi:hypothetical protein
MNKILFFIFQPRYSVDKSVVVFSVFAVISAMLLVPLKVTVDGWLYLSSARSLFTNNMEENYYWIREPGYPFLLKLIHTFSGNADLGLIFVQSIILTFAIAISIKAFSIMLDLKELNLFYLIIIYILFLNPYIIGFTGMVLQQVVFSLFLSISSLAITILYKKHNILKSFILLFSAYILAILTSIAFLIIFIPVILTYLIIFFSVLGKKTKASFLARLLYIAAVPLAAGFFYFVGVWVLRFWNTFKQANSKSSSLPIEQVSLEQANSSVVSVIKIPNFLSGILENFELYRDNFLSLLHLGTSKAFPFYEISILVSHQFAPQWRCGSYDPFATEPYASYGLGYFAGTCRSEFFHGLAGNYLNYAEILYVMMTLTFIIFSVVVLVTKKRYVFLLLIPQYSLLFAYALSNAGIDRYGFPIIPTVFGMLIIINMNKIYQKLRITKNSVPTG